MVRAAMDACPPEYHAQVARVEIINAASELQRVYFWVPDVCRHITETAKQKLLWSVARAQTVHTHLLPTTHAYGPLSSLWRCHALRVHVHVCVGPRCTSCHRSVDRDTPGKQVPELFHAVDEFAAEMRHNERCARFSAWRWLMEQDDNGAAFRLEAIKNMPFFLALVQNCLLLARFSIDFSGEDLADAVEADPTTFRRLKQHADSAEDGAASGLSIAARMSCESSISCWLIEMGFLLFGLLQLATCIFSAASHSAGLRHCACLQSRSLRRVAAQLVYCRCIVCFFTVAAVSFPVRQHTKWFVQAKRGRKKQFEQALNDALYNPKALPDFLLRTLLYTLTDTTILLYTAMFAAAVLGLTMSRFWFAIHLLDIVNKSRDLSRVIRAVTTNGSSIVMTSLLGIVVVHLYSVRAGRAPHSARISAPAATALPLHYGEDLHCGAWVTLCGGAGLRLCQLCGRHATRRRA